MRYPNLGEYLRPGNEEHSHAPICGMLTKQSAQNGQISVSLSGKKQQ